MVTVMNARLRSDLPIPPGELLEEELDVRGMTQTEFAQHTGYPEQMIREIVKGNEPITHAIALAFERVPGIPADMWVKLEAGYQEATARRHDAPRLD